MSAAAHRTWPTTVGYPLAVFVVILATWESGVWNELFGLESFILPAPSDIAASASDNASELWSNFRKTMQPASLGFLLGNTFGFLVALALIRLPAWFSRRLSTALVAIQAIPILAIVPIVALYVGSGGLFKLITVTILVFPPTMIYMFRGMMQVDERMLELMASYEASTQQTIHKVRLPAAIPYLFASMRYTAVISLIGVLVCEILRISEGLGYQAFEEMTRFDSAKGWTAVIALSLTGIVAYALLTLIERVAFPWSQESHADL